MSLSLLSSSTYQKLPPPTDEEAVRVGLARWREAAAELDDPHLAAFIRDFADNSSGARLLAALFGNSPFLTHCCLKDPGFLRELIEQGYETVFAALLDRLDHRLAPATERPLLMDELRVLKRRAALLIAIADIAQAWTLEQVTGALSDFAEATLTLVIRHLLAQAAAAGDIVVADPRDPARGSGVIVLAMGKLGARELNYSSDIDLILLYDSERARYAGKRDAQAFFTGLAHDLVRIMTERTAEGYVFRIDLRLRPDPGSTPPILSVPAALGYYESAGQNWERAALIKARPAAGDREAGAAFLTEIRPFLWRKHLDFAAIQDIHSIKRQINAHRGGRRIAVAGHNVKLGRGGIREIEFFAQTQQLIWGGRLSELRVPGTCAALQALAASRRITAEAAAALIGAYGFLRRLEHRLQMVEDAQTHTLPADAEGIRRVALFMGFPSAEAFTAEARRQMGTVESQYMHLFEEAPSLSAPGNLVFTGIEDDPETLETLSRLGFAEPATIAAIIRGWHHGRYRATRSQRARELLTELVPGLLTAFGASANPDTAFLRFDEFLARLPAGVQFFSLFYNNPHVMALVAEIMGTAPRLAEAIAQRPSRLDGMLTAGFLDPLPPLPVLVAELNGVLDGARHYEEMLDLARRWASDRKFQLGVQLLRHRLDGEAAGGVFADIAEATIACLLPRVTAEFEHNHGRVKEGGLVVLGLGKLGSREMTVTSDLDLILLYDAPESAEASDGPRPLPVATYYARLSQRLINVLTVLTAEGNLYEVDMRLRPSGTSGPLASSFAAFRRYHDELAWTWEQMALTRARAVAGPAPLAGAVMAAVQKVLARERDPAQLAVEVDDMRRRIAELHRDPPIWQVKHVRGGMVDIEFIAQYLQLREAARAPAVLRQNTRTALYALAAAGALTRADADELAHALLLWRNLQSLLKLMAAEPFDENEAPPTLRAILAQGAGSVDFAMLKADMEAAAQHAFRHYRRLIEAPAAAARRATEEKTR